MDFYALVLIAFLGNTFGRLIRTGSAFAMLNQGWGFMAFLATTFALGRLISSFLGGELTKKVGARITSAGMAIMGGVGIAYYFSPPEYYLPIRVIHGLTAGFTWPSLQAVTMSKVDPKRRGRASSLYFASTNLGWFLAFFLGGLLAKESLIPASIALIVLAIVLLKEKGKVRKGEGRKREERVFAPPTHAILLSAIGLGFLTVLVNTEVAIAAFGYEFGRTFGGLILGLAALIGSGISYFLNKTLIDIKESHLSMLLPSLSASLSGFLISLSAPISAVGLILTKSFVMWWRSTLLGLSRTGDVGRRVGIFNAGGDGGRLLCSAMLSLGPWALPIAPAVGLTLGLIAWLISKPSSPSSPTSQAPQRR